MYKSSLRHIHDPVLLSLKVEVICFVLSCFPPSLPHFHIPRPHMCIGSKSRLSLREGSTAQAAMTSLCYDSCEFHWNKRRLRHIHVEKVKCTLVQALRLCTGRTANRGSTGIALLFRDHGTRSGWGVSVTPWLLFTPGKDPVPIVQEAGWAPGPVWTGAENLAPTGIRSPDRPARSQSLYRLRYPAHAVLQG